MKGVRIKKQELAEIVAKNRETHIREYNEGMAAFKTLFLEKVESVRTAAEADEFNAGELIRLQKPASHEKDYDRVLRMLELEVEETAMLDEEAFRNLVMDEWEWKERFTAANKLYSESISSRR